MANNSPRQHDRRRRLAYVAALVLVLQTMLAADEPTSALSQKPQWERMLKGEDAKRAADLQQRINAEQQADQYGMAVKLTEELLDLRRKQQGADHWETVNEKWQLNALRGVAATSADDRAAWRRARKGSNDASELEVKGQYASAEPLRREYLRQCEMVFGEKHPYTALSYNNVAYNLGAQGKYGEALPLCQKALELRVKLLGEKHPYTAQSYNNVAHNLDSQGMHRKAQPLYQKALELRLDLLGEQHSDTADSYNNLAYNLSAQGKYADAEPLFQKALDLELELFGEKHLRTAIGYNNLAYNLQQQGKYDAADPLYRKALGHYLELFGEKHATTITIMDNLALNLGHQEKYAEAEVLHRKALKRSIELFGEKHLAVARTYNNLAGNLDSQVKNSEAQPLYEKALEVRRDLLGEKHPDTATSYNNLAYNLSRQGKYAEARPLFEKSLAVLREILGENHPNVALAYINLAGNLNRQQKYADAQPLYQKALDLSLNVLGAKHPQVALCHRLVAANLRAQGKQLEAQGLEETAESLREGPADLVDTYQRQVKILRDQFKYADSEAPLRKLLDLIVARFGKLHPRTAAVYTELAATLSAQGKDAEARPLYEQAVEQYRQLHGENHPDTALAYRVLGLNLHALGKFADARRILVRAVASYEAARLNVADSGLERALFSERSPYGVLAAVQARLGDSQAAWLAAEADLARGLSDEMAARRGLPLSPKQEQLRLSLGQQQSKISARIVPLVSKQTPTDGDKRELHQLQEERRALEAKAFELAVALSKRELASLAEVQAALAEDAALILWIEVRGFRQEHQERWGCVVRRSGNPHWQPLPATKTGGGKWEDEAVVRWKFERAIKGTPFMGLGGLPVEDEVLPRLAKQLYARRIAPLERHLKDARHLVVVPAREMACVPVDLLTDAYVSSYVHSGTVLAKLKSQPSAVRNALLAVGNPWPLPAASGDEAMGSPPGLRIGIVVPGTSAAKAGLLAGDRLLKYGGVEISSSLDLSKAPGGESIPVTIWRAGKTFDAELQPKNLGIAFIAYEIPMRGPAAPAASWSQLPATAIEVRRIAALVDDKHSVVLTRSAASELAVERIRESGALARFRYVHFATHGEPNDARAFESALILSHHKVANEAPRPGEKHYDGRLTANEVLENWQLNAELVTLSACESALGRPGGGDGLLGFAQAFLLAGARSVCLSLWKVDDTASALLMDRFYQNLLGKRGGLSKHLPKAEALAEAKRWLRNLTVDEATTLAADMTKGLARGKNDPALKLVVPAAEAKGDEPDDHPFAHPRYWAAFILIGDPN